MLSRFLIPLKWSARVMREPICHNLFFRPHGDRIWGKLWGQLRWVGVKRYEKREGAPYYQKATKSFSLMVIKKQSQEEPFLYITVIR